MTDKPFDHEEYSRERLQQTTPGDGSDFKGHLVHRPGRIEPTTGAGEGERWEKQHLGPDEDNPFRDHFLFWAVKDSYSRLAVCFAEKDADLIVKLHNAREADQQTIAELKTTVRRLEREHPALVYALEKLDTQAQTIADLRAETERWQEFANGYMRDLTAAEQTIAELRKALKALLRQTNNIEVLGEWSAEDRNHASQKRVRAEVDAVKAQALAAIAATEGDKPS